MILSQRLGPTVGNTLDSVTTIFNRYRSKPKRTKGSASYPADGGRPTLRPLRHMPFTWLRAEP